QGIGSFQLLNLGIGGSHPSKSPRTARHVLSKTHISTSERYAAASRSLLGLVAFERVVVLFIVLAGIVQRFRLGGHMAERAGFLFFSLYTRAWRMKGSSSQQCRETERTLE